MAKSKKNDKVLEEVVDDNGVVDATVVLSGTEEEPDPVALIKEEEDLTDEDLATGNYVDDIHFQIDGPVAHSIMEAFAGDWSFTTEESLDQDYWWPPIGEGGTVQARGLRSGPDADIYKIEMLAGSDHAAPSLVCAGNARSTASIRPSSKRCRHRPMPGARPKARRNR